MNLRGSREREDPEINFIPLIDVLLVILIFLMVTTTYQRIAELSITLPEANADPAKDRPREINVGLDAQGRYKIGREPTLSHPARCCRFPSVFVPTSSQPARSMTTCFSTLKRLPP